MGIGYTRRDTTNQISNGVVIDAIYLDAEFDGVASAMVPATGHTHDGSVGEGAAITKLGPTQNLTVSATSVVPTTTNTVDVGSSANRMKDGYFAGSVIAASVSGPLTGNVTGNVTGNTSGTHTGPVVGAVTGNTSGTHTGPVTGVVTGDTAGTHTGSVIGNVTGNTAGTHTGPVIGSVTGPLTGNVTGSVSGGTVSGNGSGLTALDAGQVTLGTLADARLATNIVRDTRSITVGTGLTGGGDLTANRSIAIDATVVTTSGTQTIGGNKTFSSIAVTGGTIVNITDLTIADGGTGQSTAPAALLALGGQPIDSNLTSLAAVPSAGILVKTGAGTSTSRSLVAGSGVSVANDTGVAGNPTITSLGIGWNQTWQNLTASRAFSTVYTNSTTAPIVVSVVTSFGNVTGFTEFYASGIRIQRHDNNPDSTNMDQTVMGVVPVGQTYEVRCNGSSATWAELRA